jgi:iron complex outermembrane receptor protein
LYNLHGHEAWLSLNNGGGQVFFWAFLKQGERIMKQSMSRKLWLCAVLMAALLMLATRAAMAQTSEQRPGQTTNLAPVTVYGLADQEPTAPVNTRYGTQYNVVTDEQIKKQNSLDFLDALRNVPGVMYRKSNMMGTTTSADIFIRGRGAGHPGGDLAIYFDGVPRNGFIYGQSMANGIPVFAIGGMEIYKYPQPSVFGSGYGLVNIIPKRMAEEGFEVKVGLQGGSYGTMAEDMSMGFKSGSLDLYAVQSWVSSDGYGQHARYQQQNYYLNLGYRFNEHWNLRWLANHVEAQALHSDDPITGRPRYPERYDTETDFTTLTLSHTYDKFSGYVKLYYNKLLFSMRGERNGTSLSQQEARATGIRAREVFNLWEGGEIVAGFDLDSLHSTNKDFNRSSSTSTTTFATFPDMLLFSPYLAISHYFGEEDGFHLIPSAGVRFYRHNKFANKTAPQAGLLIGYANTDLHFNYARGVNYPAPVVLQGFFYNSSTGYSIPSNFDTKRIKPEVVDHYEIGITHAFPGKAKLGASYFYDSGKDRLRAYMGGPFNLSQPFNYSANTFKIRGFELNASVTPIEPLEIFAGATWLKVKAKGENGVSVDRLPYTPDFSMSAGFRWDILPNLHLNADYQHLEGIYGGTIARPSGNYSKLTDAEKMGDINLVNMRLSVDFSYEPLRISEAQLFLAVDNVFDKDYAYDDRYPMPGTTFMLGAEFTFK